MQPALWAIFALLLIFNPAAAATFYVDRVHPQASDSNPGSEALPWLTVQHAADMLTTGNTVLVKAGTYNESLIPTASGAIGQPITYRAFGNGPAILDGSGISVPAFDGLVSINNQTHIIFDGFTVQNVGPIGTNSGIQVSDSSEIEIRNNHTINTASSGIQVWGSSQVIVDGNEVEGAAAAGVDSENECITIGESDDFQISNNHVHDGGALRGEGIDAKDGSSNGEVFGNHVHHVQGVGIYVDAWDKHTHDIAVFANRVHDIDGDGFAIGSESGGLLENINVYNNLSYNNALVGISIHECCIASHPLSSILVINNTVYNNGSGSWGGGIQDENDQAIGVIIRNNIVSDNLSFQIALEIGNPETVTVDHNLIHGFRDYDGETRGIDYQEGDPRFVDPENGDFRLQSESPAVDNGSAALAPSDDFLRTSRPQGEGYEIGAYEATPELYSDGFEGFLPG